MRFHRPSPAMLVALLALVVALGGTSAVAAPAVKRLLSGRTIKKGSLPGNRVAKGSLPADRVRPEALGGRQIDEARLGTVPTARTADTAARAAVASRAEGAGRADAASRAETAGRADSAARADAATRADAADVAGRVMTYEPVPLRRAPAHEGATQEAALAAAPAVPIGRRGPFELYGKCVRVGAGDPKAFVLVRTAQAGSLDTTGELFGPGEERQLGGATYDLAPGGRPVANLFTLVGADGTIVRGLFHAYSRLAPVELAESPARGPFREGDDCLFTATIGD